MPNFSSLARLEVPEKFLWVGGGVCKVILMSNPTVVLRLGWGFDNIFCRECEFIYRHIYVSAPDPDEEIFKHFISRGSTLSS